MICRSTRLASAAFLALISAFMLKASAQQQVPAAPPQEPAPQEPASGPTAAPTFPKPDPANFTATAPTKETINGFLQATWGYDPNRIWQVQAILKTQVEGISRVVILIGDKTGKQKPAPLQFFSLPDGKHIIAGDEILPFGDHPYAAYRARNSSKAPTGHPRDLLRKISNL